MSIYYIFFSSAYLSSGTYQLSNSLPQIQVAAPMNAHTFLYSLLWAYDSISLISIFVNSHLYHLDVDTSIPLYADLYEVLCKSDTDKTEN